MFVLIFCYNNNVVLIIHYFLICLPLIGEIKIFIGFPPKTTDDHISPGLYLGGKFGEYR